MCDFFLIDIDSHCKKTKKKNKSGLMEKKNIL